MDCLLTLEPDLAVAEENFDEAAYKLVMELVSRHQ